MVRVKYGQTRARGQPKALLDRPSVSTKRKNANKKALRRAEGNASVLRANALAMFSDPNYIREQWLYQLTRRQTKELPELRNKRRWIQGQLDDDNIDGSTARGLLKLYDNAYFGKPQGQRPRIEDTSGGAKLVNQHLEYAIRQHSDGMDGVAVKDEEEGEEEEEWNGFSSNEEE